MPLNLTRRCLRVQHPACRIVQARLIYQNHGRTHSLPAGKTAGAKLTPDHIHGKKELVINHPGQVGFEAFNGTWTFHEDDTLDISTLNNIMNLLAERTGQSYNMANPILSVKLPGGHRAQFVCGLQNAHGFSLCVRLANVRDFELTN